jgi:hypothetical protein
LTSLRYAGQQLLTTAPSRFRPPQADYGRYETRAVYGYDDCFPTVDACEVAGWSIPDHGELCWLPWECWSGDDHLCFRCESRKLRAAFHRCLKFSEGSLGWQFEVTNSGAAALPFVHVMHALMPVGEIVGIRLPEFSRAVDEASGQAVGIVGPTELAAYLLALERGKAAMLLLHDARPGGITVSFRSGIRLEIDYPREVFPTLGIWWNNHGYPDEEGCRRAECAFEPIPGRWSSLAASLRDGTVLEAPAYGSAKWAINWKIL